MWQVMVDRFPPHVREALGVDAAMIEVSYATD